MGHLCYLCLVFVMLSRRFIAAPRSPAGKGLTSWLLFVMFNCAFVTFPCGVLGQVWNLIYRFLIFAAFLTLIECRTIFHTPYWWQQLGILLIFITTSVHVTSTTNVLHSHTLFIQYPMSKGKVLE